MTKHRALLSRHEQLVLEGQERLRYVQAQVRTARAQMPPPPPPPKPGEEKAKALGPEVTAVPVVNATCWATCFGLEPPPRPPPPPPLPRTVLAPPMIVPLPPPSYFREAVAARLGLPQAANAHPGTAESVVFATSPDEVPTATQPFTASAGGASDAARSPPDRRQRGASGGSAGGSPSGGGMDLPGQLRTSAAAPADAAPAAHGPRNQAGGELVGAAQPPAASSSPQPWSLSPLGALASLAQPLTPGGRPRSDLGAGGGGSGPRKAVLPPMRPSPAREGGPRSSLGASKRRGQDQGPGRPASSPSQMAADAASLNPVVVDLDRYRDPESLRRITLIQAAQRGRLARRQAAALRAQAAAGPLGAKAGEPPGGDPFSASRRGLQGNNMSEGALPPLSPKRGAGDAPDDELDLDAAIAALSAA
ncbi:hypothetical protein GPECTOR_95g698 [Gonium pectorale]|uniref:Uncharacterized protein n=1 Tax=Gonium pectorale TaxID=33097 RepID=A0A150G0D0_GONPE|nr:hypothetical protein GPECTOR_95g698 [Gonium pectorale]|eukprot:KXZ43309.1 hypothetical protein GPECTOR_95g698 [Gonium pectorale]